MRMTLAKYYTWKDKLKKKLIVINLAESELKFREREFQTEKRERNISENAFLLISNDDIS